MRIQGRGTTETRFPSWRVAQMPSLAHLPRNMDGDQWAHLRLDRLLAHLGVQRCRYSNGFILSSTGPMMVLVPSETWRQIRHRDVSLRHDTASSAFVWLVQTRIQCWHGDRQRLRTIWSRWASPARQVPMEDSHGRGAESSAQVVNQGHSAAALGREKRFDNHHVATGHCEQWIDETKDLAQMRGLGGHANANDDLAALARTCAHLADSRAHRTAATGTTPISPPAELSVCFSHNIITRPHHASTTHATLTHSPRHTSLCPVISSP